VNIKWIPIYIGDNLSIKDYQLIDGDVDLYKFYTNCSNWHHIIESTDNLIIICCKIKFSINNCVVYKKIDQNSTS